MQIGHNIHTLKWFLSSKTEQTIFVPVKKAFQCISQWKSQLLCDGTNMFLQHWQVMIQLTLWYLLFISIKKIIEELFIVNVVVEVVEIVIVVLHCIVAYLFLFLLSSWSLLSLQSLLSLLLMMMFFLLLGTEYNSKSWWCFAT